MAQNSEVASLLKIRHSCQVCNLPFAILHATTDEALHSPLSGHALQCSAGKQADNLLNAPPLHPVAKAILLFEFLY